MKIPGLFVSPDAQGDIASLAWRTTRYPGVDWIDLASSSDGTATVLIRMAPGCGYPEHRHVGPEDVLVLSGGYRDDDGTGSGAEHRAGTFVRYPEGSVHSPIALEEPSGEPCLLFAVAHRGTERVAAHEPEPSGG